MTTPHPTPEERYEAAVKDLKQVVENEYGTEIDFGVMIEGQDLFKIAMTAAIREAEAAGEARGRAAHLSIISEWLDVGMLKLRAGELSAQEIRTVIAVLTAIAAAVRARTDKENSDG